MPALLMRRPMGVAALFAVAALLLRWPSFFPSVINHDESTYIVIADAMRKGALYFVDVIDNKPIGIFLIFAAIQELFGDAIATLRLVTALWTAATAFLLYVAHRRLGSSDSAGLASGLIYLVMISIFTDFGLSPNTELFFNLFTAGALCLLFPEPGTWRAFPAGLLLGMGFLVKYVVAFDALAFGLVLVWLHREKGVAYIAKTGLLAAVGFFLPVGLLAGYYHQAGLFDRLWFYTFELSTRYLADMSAGKYAVFMADFFARFLPVSIWYFWAFTRRSATPPAVKILGAVWSVAVIAAILLPGRLFYHYYIQFMLPFVLIAGCFFDSRQVHGRFWTWWLRFKTGGVALALLVLANTAVQVREVMLKPDRAREVADWLNSRLRPDELVYTGNFHQIVYHLIDRPSPTPYVHRSLLHKANLMYAQGIDHNTEMQKILKKEPAYILVQKEYPIDTSVLLDTLALRYRLVKTFEDDVRVYQRNTGQPESQ